MASNKANRKQLANSNWQFATPKSTPKTNPQPNPHPQNTEPPSPVKAHVYRALAELNAGFEKVIQDLKTLQQVGFLRSERLAGMHDLVCEIRAEANHECLGILNDREMANGVHFGGLCPLAAGIRGLHRVGTKLR